MTNTYLLADIQTRIGAEVESINACLYMIQNITTDSNLSTAAKAEVAKVLQYIVDGKVVHQKKLQKLFDTFSKQE